MPKRERDEAVAELSSTIFSAMLEEILMDVVQQSHKEIARARAVCDVCHTRCNAVHVPGPSNAGTSRIPTPNGDLRAGAGDGNSPSATGTNTPVNGASKDGGTVYLACLECNREIASNRYATHLSACMGIGNRRGAARNATAKAKLGSEQGKSASPRLASEAAHLSDDGGVAGKALPAKGKGKGKAKKTDDSTLNSNGKRTASPSISPTKKSKKQKTTGPAATRVKSELDSPVPSSNLLPVPSATRVPSKLRESSIASSFQRDQRSSSPDSPNRLSSPARSISTQASTVIRSPVISSATIKSKQANGKGRGAPAPPRLPSPPRPPPPIIRMPDTDYLPLIEGEETGSSTDTDSD